MEAEWITSQRGGRILQDTNKFQYNFLRCGSNGQIGVYWCVKYFTLKCHAMAYVDISKIVIIKSGEHNGHSTEIHKRQASLGVSEYVTHAAGNSMVPPRRVRGDILGAPDAIHAVPKANAIAMQISRARKKVNQFPALPSSLADLKEIPDEFAKTSSGGQFLVMNEWMDEQLQDKRSLIFMSEMGKFLLSTATEWFLDGTFSTAPHFFTQVFIICGKLANGTVLPGAFLLLPDKEAATYRKVINFPYLAKIDYNIVVFISISKQCCGAASILCGSDSGCKF
jgi:hypothetical protein